MSLLQETKSLLRKYRIEPNKSLGQNFTVEPWIFERMIEYGSLDSNDTVLDIGAGFGFLTRMMAKKCKMVIAVETQPELVEALQSNLSGLQNVTIMSGSILKLDIPDFDKAVSIPPYGLSSRLLTWLYERNFQSALIVFQKEFADRLTALTGSRDYGWLSVMSSYHAQVEHLDKVPRSSFFPPPKIDSIIVRLTANVHPPFEPKNKRLFFHMTRFLFTQRNKKVRSVAVSFFRNSQNMSKQNAAKFANVVPFSEKRVRDLAPEDFGVLADAVEEEESAV